MAAETVYSTAHTSGVRPDACVPAGILLARTGIYTATGALDADSVIQLIPMPKGAQLIDLLLSWTALGASRTLDAGICDTDYTGYDIDMFFDGIAAEYAGVARWGASTINDAAANLVHGVQFIAGTWPYEFTANGTIDVKVLGGTFPTSAVITGVAFYKQEGAIDDET